MNAAATQTQSQQADARPVAPNSQPGLWAHGVLEFVEATRVLEAETGMTAWWQTLRIRTHGERITSVLVPAGDVAAGDVVRVFVHRSGHAGHVLRFSAARAIA